MSRTLRAVPALLLTVLCAALLVPAAFALADGAALLPVRVCTTTAVDRHLGTGPTCLDTRLDPEGVRRLVTLWRGQ